jgi:glutamate decarboxylase
VNGGPPKTALVDYQEPANLRQILGFNLRDEGRGKEGFLEAVEKILQYSVNTWDQGFLDKLYASTNAVGVASELILAALNTNVHVYQVSPVLSIIEKTCTQYLASLFGLCGRSSGGISVQGGSASNQTSVVIARNILYPSTKTEGHGPFKFVLFTSAHGHYSLEKAAQMFGFGSSAVWSVPVDNSGRMVPSALENLVEKAKVEGRTPFYVNATAGTTVLGSFDPFSDIAAICKKNNLWFHIDASWGGPLILSSSQKWKLDGSHLADSIAINPHKMLGVPITCSFLLGADMRRFHKANTLPAGYLFHNDENLEGPEDAEVWDLADLTLQCGRKGDSVKFFLGMIYYGASGYATQIDNAVSMTAYLTNLIAQSPDLLLVSENPPPCLQVCFNYAPDGQSVYEHSTQGAERKNSRITEEIARRLIQKGFMVDFAPPTSEDTKWRGKFFRAVINRETRLDTVEGLVKAVVDIGKRVLDEIEGVSESDSKHKADGTVLPPKLPGKSAHGPAMRNR